MSTKKIQITVELTLDQLREVLQMPDTGVVGMRPETIEADDGRPTKRPGVFVLGEDKIKLLWSKYKSGVSMKQIARDLGVSDRTVRRVVKDVLRT